MYRFFLAILGRQSGKSWLARYAALDSSINEGLFVMWVSPTITTARAHWNAIVDLVEKSGLPIRRISRNDKEIHFHGGGVLSIRTAIEPNNLRGASVDLLILDEAAFYRDGAYVWYSVCLPMITASRGKVLFPTTPNGRNWIFDLFSRGCDPASLYYKSWHMPSTEAPHQDHELLAELKETMPDLKWREEFLAEFLADKGGVFAGLDKAAVVAPLQAPLEGHVYVAGIDFGYSEDATTFTVIDKYERKQVFGAHLTNVGTVQLIKRLADLMEIWHPEVTHIEKNGLGVPLYAVLRLALSGKDIEDIDWQLGELPAVSDEEDTAGGFVLKALHMTNDMKVTLIERLAADIEYGGLQILGAEASRYGEIQQQEMATFQRQRTPRTQSITYGAARGCHDDTISSLSVCYKGVPKRKKWKLPKPKSEGRKNPFRADNRRKRLDARSSELHSGNGQRARQFPR